MGGHTAQGSPCCGPIRASSFLRWGTPGLGANPRTVCGDRLLWQDPQAQLESLGRFKEQLQSEQAGSKLTLG